MVVDPGLPVVGGQRPQLRAVDGRVEVELGHARSQRGEVLLEDLPGPHAGHEAEVVGEDGAGLGRHRPGRETEVALHGRADHPQGQSELERQLQVDVEELGPQLQRAHVRVEVADVEAPQDGPLDLGPALAADLVEVGVVPDVLERPREPAVTAEQRRRVR